MKLDLSPRHYRFMLFVVLLTIGVFPSSGFSETCQDWIARVMSVQGQILAQKTGTTERVPVKLNDTYSVGDTIFVGQKSRLGVVLCNDALLRFDQNTTLTFSGVERKRTSILELIKGAVHFFSRTPRGVKVATPFVNGSVEGTEFFVKVDVEREETFISIFEGKVRAENSIDSLLLASGESALTKKEEAPQRVTVIRPRDAVQWAMHYPPVLSFRAKDFPGDTEWEVKIRQSIDFYWKGQLTQAFAPLEGVSERIRDPRFFVYRAVLLLTVGRADEARPDIERALALDPKMSEAVALQAVIAVVQNDKKKAMELANKAVEMNVQSSAARVALSYAQQAHFDLEGALKSLEEATRMDGENAYAWARLSEIWQSLGYLDKSLLEAQKAISFNPNLSRTQSVLGFAYLTQIKIKESIAAFEKAILLDQAAPLPRLGLGLAKIRDGDLQEGRREIEIAAALDPNNSLIRSYLGKAYFEEKRNILDQREFDIAKELDPNDPTPYFYDAIRLQSVNRPVEALKNIQKSIELNDNRAVYRSKLLLDQDLAARSASLGRIYQDLGFEQLALIEGFRSVHTDPGNYSTHRFLADTYATLPRHEIARVSELLQSQILQPININPVQPSLAESNLFILEGAGPTDSAFNEFNPLFNRNRLALQASGVVSENNTFGDELVFSGVEGGLSFSIGQFHYESDGFRENNDQAQNIYNILAQGSLSYRTSVLTEFRYKDVKRGDLFLLFDPDDFLPDFREKEKRGSIRFGLRHTFSPNNDLLLTGSYQELDTDVDWSPGERTEVDQSGYGGEAQHLFRKKRIHLISGGGYFTIDREDLNIFFSGSPLRTKTDIDHTNLYLYALVNYPEHVTWTLGGSGDFFEGGLLDLDVDQFNPKFGVMWNPAPSTTLRGAVFRTLNRTLILNQTLEPTQVAGFNQFFDDGEGTDAWRYGVGLDQKISPSIFAGTELSKRELKVTGVVFGPEPAIQESDLEEMLIRAYLNWVPFSWLSLAVDYQFEQFDRPLEFTGPELITDLDTHRFSIGIGGYHPSGFNVRLTPTYVHQDGKFAPQGPFGNIISGDDQFWILDASISYRLPKRYGIITLEAKNLFDESFNFQDTDPSNPRIYPERLILGKITFSF